MPLLVILFLMAISWLFSEALGLFLHEFAHALVGRLVGYQIREIRIGQGRALLTWRIKETTLRIGRIWRGGLVLPYPSFNASRLTGVLFVAAGPLSDILFLWGLLVLCGSGLVPRDGFIFVFAAAFCQVHRLYHGLVPARVKLFGETLSNDGKLILDILRGRDSYDERWKDFYAGQLKACWNGEGEPPQLSSASPRIIYNLYVRRDHPTRPLDTEARLALVREIERGLHPAEEVLVLDGLTTNALFDGDAALLPMLDAWSARMLQLNPGRATSMGTRGGVLVQLGRHGEALGMLAQADYSDPFNIMLNRVFQSQAVFRSGDPVGARDFLAQALAAQCSAKRERSGPAWGLVERTAKEIGVELGDSTLLAETMPAADCA